MSSISDNSFFLTTANFIRMDGMVVPSGPLMRDISQPGLYGSAWNRYAYRGKPFTLRTQGAYSSALNLALGQILYTQYQTHVINLTDDRGITWSQIIVKEVRPVEAEGVLNGVGNIAGAAYILHAEWDCESIATGY